MQRFKQTWNNTRNRVKYSVVALIFVLILAGVVLLVRRRSSDPTNNPDYARVAELVQEGQFRPQPAPALADSILLPTEYKYLSRDGRIGIDTANKTVIVFNFSGDPKNFMLDAYVYTSDDKAPTSGDFPPLSMADGHTCQKLQPNWFSCNYGWH